MSEFERFSPKRYNEHFEQSSNTRLLCILHAQQTLENTEAILAIALERIENLSIETDDSITELYLAASDQFEAISKEVQHLEVQYNTHGGD